MSSASRVAASTPASTALRGEPGHVRAAAARPGQAGGREALVEFVRAINTTLEPATIAAVVVDRAATWMPLPSWVLVSSDQSGQPLVLGDRALPIDIAPAIQAIGLPLMPS